MHRRWSPMLGLIAILCAACATPVATGQTTGPIGATAGPSQAASPAATPAAAATVDPTALDVVRGWLEAMNAGNLEQAATFFAPGARVGSGSLVQTNSPAEVIAALQEAAKCHHAITSTSVLGRTVYADVEISGGDCPFLEPGETTHGIQIPVLVVDGKIACTCPEGT